MTIISFHEAYKKRLMLFLDTDWFKFSLKYTSFIFLIETTMCWTRKYFGSSLSPLNIHWILKTECFLSGAEPHSFPCIYGHTWIHRKLKEGPARKEDDVTNICIKLVKNITFYGKPEQTFWLTQYLHCGSAVKNLPADAKDAGSIPRSGRYSGEGNGNSLQYSCLGNPMDKEAWRLQSMEFQRVGHNLATKQKQLYI